VPVEVRLQKGGTCRKNVLRYVAIIMRIGRSAHTQYLDEFKGVSSKLRIFQLPRPKNIPNIEVKNQFIKYIRASCDPDRHGPRSYKQPCDAVHACSVTLTRKHRNNICRKSMPAATPADRRRCALHAKPPRFSSCPLDICILSTCQHRSFPGRRLER
jgi:hypothetical protein